MYRLLLLIFATCISMIGYTIHGSIFWSVMDFMFSPITLVKWLFYHEITLTIIKQTFSFFL